MALTFDDGPWLHTTEQILAILAHRRAPATVFVVGRQVQRYPQLLRRELAAGMAVGTHTYSHPPAIQPASGTAHPRGDHQRPGVPSIRWACGRSGSGPWRHHRCDRRHGRRAARLPHHAVDRRPGRLAAALTIANTIQSEQRGELAEQLQRALDARVVIEQAKGALVAREGLSEREAFERMRRQARSQRRRVVEVAAEVMAAIRQP